MNRELAKAILVLPGTALVYVPGAIVWLSGAMAPAGVAEPRFWIGAALAVAGFAVAVWTVRLFAAESLLLGSWHVAGWAVVFFVLNAVYFARVEEPALERRFGEGYRLYKANVPRWIPRWRPWEAP